MLLQCPPCNKCHKASKLGCSGFSWQLRPDHKCTCCGIKYTDAQREYKRSLRVTGIRSLESTVVRAEEHWDRTALSSEPICFFLLMRLGLVTVSAGPSRWIACRWAGLLRKFPGPMCLVEFSRAEVCQAHNNLSCHPTGCSHAEGAVIPDARKACTA